MAGTKNDERPIDALRCEASYLSAAERLANGKTVRDAVPRASHAGWKPGKVRRDPIERLAEFSAGRVQRLVPIRFGRTAESPVAL